MYTKDTMNDLYRRIAMNIDISDEMFEAAEDEYSALGKWIDANTPQYKISIYPQGSFALGTVVKPITNTDDYDLDVVCEFTQSYGLTAKELKVDVVKPLLMRYKKTSTDIREKRRCWHVEYEDLPSFHMDVIPAYANAGHINITDHLESIDFYRYMGSNPAGYIKWFFDRCAKQRTRLYETYVREHRIVVAQADIEKVKRRKIKTPLQRVIQLLKRHRDVMFQNDKAGLKPISIIITTIAAHLYEEEDNIFDAMDNILSKAPLWIESHRRNGEYFIENPSFPGENFADKWNTHPERAQAFIEWLRKARNDLTVAQLLNKDRVSMGMHIRSVFGEATGKSVYTMLAEDDRKAIKDGFLKVAPATGALASTGTIQVTPNHHHGK